MATDGPILGRVYCGWPRAQGKARGRAGGYAVLLALGLASGGCTVSMPMGARTVAEPQATGSTVPKPASLLSPELSDEDWRRARGALAIALDPQGNGSPVSWDNPQSLAKGNFVPVGQPFVKSDEICRAFLATIGGPGSSTSLQGTACRPSGGEWVIKDTKSWHKQA